MMSIVNRTKNAMVLTLLVSCTTPIQTVSLIFERDVNPKTNQSIIYLAERNNRNPFRRRKQPGGGQIRINETNQIKT